MQSETSVSDFMRQEIEKFQREVTRLAREQNHLSPTAIIVVNSTYSIVEPATIELVVRQDPMPGKTFGWTDGLGKRARKCLSRTLGKQFHEIATISAEEVAQIEPTAFRKKNFGDGSLAEIHAALLEVGVEPRHKNWPAPKKYVPPSKPLLATSADISDEDWAVLSNAQWKREDMGKLVNEMKVRKNKLLTSQEEEKLIGRVNHDFANVELRRLKLPFRFRTPPGYASERGRQFMK